MAGRYELAKALVLTVLVMDIATIAPVIIRMIFLFAIEQVARGGRGPWRADNSVHTSLLHGGPRGGVKGRPIASPSS